MMHQISSISNFNRIKKIVSVCAVFALVVYGLKSAQDVVCEKGVSERDLHYETYFDEPNQYDVLFFGTSHVMYGVSPLEIWNEFGIRSFNWGSPTCTIPQSYWKLMNILNYQSPKLVVIDCFRATWEYKTSEESRMHEAFDAFPISTTKIRAVNDLMYGERSLFDERKYSKEQCINMLFPLSAYHSRWDQLTERDFSNRYIDTKGAEFETRVARPIDVSDSTAKHTVAESMTGVVYLKKMIEECQKRGIDILLVYLPYPTDEYWKKEANMIDDIALAYNVNYLDFTRESVVDFDTDCADAESHLNVVGQRKVSTALGKYILDNYDVECYGNDDVKRDWNDCYLAYRDYKDKFILNTEELSSYLMLLNDIDCDYVIELDDTRIMGHDIYNKLLSELYGDIKSSVKYIVRLDGQTFGIEKNTNGGGQVTPNGRCVVITDSIGRTEISIGDRVFSLDEKGDSSMIIQVYKADEVFDEVIYRYMDDNDGTLVSDSIERKTSDSEKQ